MTDTDTDSAGGAVSVLDDALADLEENAREQTNGVWLEPLEQSVGSRRG